GAVRRNDGSDEDLARGRIPEGCAGGAGENPVMALSAEQFADLRRWMISAAIVVLAHGAIAAGLVPWCDDIEPAEPAAAIVVEFAPLPVAPDAPPTEIAPRPQPGMSEAAPERPVEQVEDEKKIEEKAASKPVEEPPPEIKPAPNPDVAIEPRPQEVAKLLPQEPRTPAPTTSAPQAIPEQSAAVPAAPMQ